MGDRNRVLLAVILVLGLAAALRFYHIGWSFSSNGIDEGIMVERSLMVSRGSVPYVDLPLDQAPLAFYLGAALDGSVVSLRTMTAAISLAALAASMYVARRMKDDLAMVMTGLLLAVDFAVVRESRTFSLDGLASFFLAFSILPFYWYIRTKSRTMLAASGIVIGLSTAVKLLGALGLIGMLVFMLMELRLDKEKRRRTGDLAVLIVTAAIPLAALMASLGVEETINGMLLDQGQRGLDLGLKLSILGYLGLNAAYLIPLFNVRRIWMIGPEARFLMVTSIAILVFMILQPLTFFHHLVLLSPPLAILAGICLSDMLGRGRGEARACGPHLVSRKSYPVFASLVSVAIVGIVVSGGFSGYGLAKQGEPFQNHYARIVSSYSSAGDWVISGDPLITALADRDTPPEVINVAYRIHPDISETTIESVITTYNVKVVVICYRLNDMSGLPSFLSSRGYALVEDVYQIHEPAMNLFEDDIGPVSVYVRGSGA